VSAPAPIDPVQRRRQKVVLVGLFLTFVGLFAASLEIPVEPSALLRTLPPIAVGLLALWVGGILLGNSVRPFGRSRSR
jgi:hypothetical protein